MEKGVRKLKKLWKQLWERLQRLKSFWTFSTHKLVYSNRQVTIGDLWPLFQNQWKSSDSFYTSFIEKDRSSLQWLITNILMKGEAFVFFNLIFWTFLLNTKYELKWKIKAIDKRVEKKSCYKYKKVLIKWRGFVKWCSSFDEKVLRKLRECSKTLKVEIQRTFFEDLIHSVSKWGNLGMRKCSESTEKFQKGFGKCLEKWGREFVTSREAVAKKV